MKPPAAMPRPGGGFNPGMGSFGDEHLEANAMQQAMQQKSLAQQMASQTGPAPASSTTTNTAPSSDQPQSDQDSGSVFTRPIEDLSQVVAELLHIDGLLGLKKDAATPEEKAKRQRIAQNYQKLNQEQQAVARAKYQERLQREQQQRQEEERKKQLAAQQNQEVVMPSSPHKGPDAGGGSRKQQAVTKLQQDRKTLGGPQSAG